MKKTFITILSIIILLGCTGCSKGENISDASGETFSVTSFGNVENTVKKVDVKTATENYGTDFENCRNASYVNLDWTSAGKCPVYPVSELYGVECGEVIGIAEIPQKEMLYKFKEYCLYYFGEFLDDFAFFDTLETIGDTVPPEIIVNGVSYRGYYKISDHREKLEKGSIKINWLVYRNIEKNQYMWWGYGDYPHWINRGTAVTIINDNIRASSWLPSDLGKPIARYYNDGKSDDIKYKLADGEVSIGEAVRYFTEEYPISLPFEDKPSYTVKYVDVYKLAEDTYGYLLWVSKLHASVSFELEAEMVTDASAVNYYTVNGQALMVRKNEIDVTLHCEPISNVKEIGEPFSKIISLKEAADIVSQKLSQNVMFEVLSTELVYHGARDEAGTAHLKPTWEFRLYNENDALYYTVYVDAASGDCNYFKYSSV
ncbi:MAG: hypothetical protein NC299_16495 [Lachnospiraceae bacterium]|nr:hypothetical protein [Ruminococcus sp.]MCM1276936.1 hypothetical protein [Lachnospiraceae bacterium]